MTTKKTVRKNRKPKASRPHMPGYGLPKGTKGLLPWSWAERRLEKSHNYWITTSKPDGSPHTMLVWGLWMDGTFLFSTGSQSRKARNLENNSRCVICNEDANEAVIVEGIAGRIRDVSTIRNFLKLYEKKYSFDMSGMADGMISFKEPVYAVQPRKVFGQNHESFVKTATRWTFGELRKQV